MYRTNLWISLNNTKNIHFVFLDLLHHLSKMCAPTHSLRHVLLHCHGLRDSDKKTIDLPDCNIPFADAEHVRCKRGTGIGCSATTLLSRPWPTVSGVNLVFQKCLDIVPEHLIFFLNAGGHVILKMAIFLFSMPLHTTALTPTYTHQHNTTQHHITQQQDQPTSLKVARGLRYTWTICLMLCVAVAFRVVGWCWWCVVFFFVCGVCGFCVHRVVCVCVFWWCSWFLMVCWVRRWCSWGS